jgi:hypothetical protein
MTYSYLLSVPLILTFSLGFTIIKYQNGYSDIPGHGIVPKPYQLWDKSSQAAIFPLMLAFSVGWSLEMVTHLEELCFWLFLVNAGSAQQDWFRSLYFRVWLVGSSVAVLYMPLVTIFTRDDHLKNEAYTFLAGSLGSLSLTLWFTPILFAFPSFLDSLREDNVDNNTIVRLTKFHELNTIRICFRFLFTVPLLILGVDGIRPHQHINESMIWTDFLAMLAAFGCVTSSGITLVIFFPRSIEGEMALRDQRRGKSRVTGFADATHPGSRLSFTPSAPEDVNGPNTASYLMGDDAQMTQKAGPGLRGSATIRSHARTEDSRVLNQTTDWSPVKARDPNWTIDGDHVHPGDSTPQPESPLRPNRRHDSMLEMGTMPTGQLSRTTSKTTQLTEGNLSRHNAVNPMVHNFRSPIDLAYGASRRRNNLEFPDNGSRLTFTLRQ